MKRILIADSSKASLVMTSEVFKDHFPGVQVVVARTSADAIELAKTAGELDAFIIDYDLPDRDGAYTAARLKKMFAQPILITAFDRPDVQETIDRDLSAFDDCLSWLKKPVKPELVVSLAQRFIEGKHRCQRRLNCHIPAFLEVEFMPVGQSLAAATGASSYRSQAVAKVKVASKSKAKQQAKTKKAATQKTTATKLSSSGKSSTPMKSAKTDKNATKEKSKTVGKTSPQTSLIKKSAPVMAKSATVPTSKTLAKKPTPTVGGRIKATPVEVKTNKQKTTPVVPAQPFRKIIPITIDDVSLGGAKIRVSNQEIVVNQPGKNRAVSAVVDFREGQILNVYVPPSHVVEAGAESLDKWQKAQAKVLINSLLSAEGKNSKSSEGVSKSTTLSPLAGRARTALANTDTEQPLEGQANGGNVLKGQVRWTASSETFTFCGLRSETVNVSKKLFEAMIEIESRARGNLSPIVSPNTPRAPKLNA
ncbi:response regulator [bacterium]|nr:response regulator [bacterium]